MRHVIDAPAPRSARDVTRASLGGRWVLFGRDERGGTSIVFMIIFSVLLLTAAMAIDYTRGHSEKSREQAALDAAMLAAAGTMGQTGSAEEAEATAQAFFRENLRNGSRARVTSFAVDSENGEITGRAGTDHPTTLMKVYDVDTMRIGVNSAAALNKSGVEIVFVLDNSGDLAGQPLVDLKGAAQRFSDMIFVGADGSNAVKVGIVPFAGSVNVGADKRGASWIDDGSRWNWDDPDTVHWENIGYDTAEKQQKVSRFTLFDRMGVSWKGCVEVRPGPFDVLDTAPDTANAATFFVPMFAPDEPDEENSADPTVSYPNSYLADYKADDDGSCPKDDPVCVRTNKKKGTCEEWGRQTVSPIEKAQKRICKYSGVTPNPISGPNRNCDSKPLTPLTNVKQKIDDAIANLTAVGRANVGEGVMWGLRVLSPTVPFTEGSEFNGGTKKYMIVLARGANTIEPVGDEMNKSEYTPWGFSSNGRLNPQSTQRTALENSMDTMSRAACRAASDTNIEVYSIGFGVSSAQTRSMLQYCATKPSMNLEASSGAELLNIFEAIARDIRQIRLAG